MAKKYIQQELFEMNYENNKNNNGQSFVDVLNEVRKESTNREDFVRRLNEHSSVFTVIDFAGVEEELEHRRCIEEGVYHNDFEDDFEESYWWE